MKVIQIKTFETVFQNLLEKQVNEFLTECSEKSIEVRKVEITPVQVTLSFSGTKYFASVEYSREV